MPRARLFFSPLSRTPLPLLSVSMFRFARRVRTRINISSSEGTNAVSGDDTFLILALLQSRCKFYVYDSCRRDRLNICSFMPCDKYFNVSVKFALDGVLDIVYNHGGPKVIYSFSTRNALMPAVVSSAAVEKERLLTCVGNSGKMDFHPRVSWE